VTVAFSSGESAVVVTRALIPGSVLTADDVRLVKLPASALPSDAINDLSQAIGERLTVPLPEGAVLDEMFLGQAAIDQLPAGYVAAAVRLSDAGLASLLTPGDHVDLMASPGASSSGVIMPAQLLAESALILSIPGRDVSPDSQNGQTDAGLLMLAVTPSQAALIGGAASWATISAVLVSAG
jgi:Flp pilus assembly protein CpaB